MFGILERPLGKLRPAPRPRQARPVLECLEGRVVPTFLPAINSPIGGRPAAVVVGDFDEDGNADVAVSNLGAGGATVLLGRGDGTFQDPQFHALAANCRYLVTADFDADRHLDLAVVSRPNQFTPGNVHLLRGDGRGGFQAAGQFPVQRGPSGAAVGDFDIDGRLDLAVVNHNNGSISLLFNDGAGGFRPAVHMTIGGDPVAVATADFNADGNLDLVVTRRFGGNVAMLHGRGDGTFAAPINYAIGTQAFGLAIGRLNADATPDVVVASREFAPPNTTVLLGTVKGGLKPPARYAAGQQPWSLELGDFDGDGAADVAVANNGAGSLSVLRNSGNGTLRDALHFPAESGPFAVAVGNFNGDTRPDAIVVNRNSASVSVYLNDGNWGDGFGGSPPGHGTGDVVAALLADASPKRR